MEVPLVDKDYLLERTRGNGGWTYAPIPEVPQDKKAPFGWVKVPSRQPTVRHGPSYTPYC